MDRYKKLLSPPLLYILVLLLTFIVHTSYLNNGFVWLDHGDIEDGRSIVPLTEIPLMFVIRFGDTAFYRPLVTLINSTDFTLYKSLISGYHLTNILVHVAVTAVVPLFLSAFFTLSLPEMLLAMLIVGIHPLTWLPVGALSYRPELLFTFFTLLTVFFHAKAQRTKKEKYRIAAVCSFFLALIAKETAIVMVPALILLWEFVQTKKKDASYMIDEKWRWSLFITEIIVLIIYFLFRTRAVPEIWKIQPLSLSFSQALGTRLHIIVKLLFDFITPFKPPLSDAVTITGIFPFLPLLGLTCIILLILLSIKAGMRSLWSRAIILFLLMLTPALAIIPVPRLGSPHYDYFPLVGFAVIIALLWRKVTATKNIQGYIFSLLLGVWLVSMSITTFVSGFHFRNDYTLFQPEIRSDPKFLEGYFYLGDYYLRQGNFKKSEQSYLASIHADPYVIAYYEKQSALINLSSVYLEENEISKADHVLSLAESISLRENGQALFHNIILLAYKNHDYKKVVLLSQDDRVFPYTGTTFFIVADSLHQLGRDEEASSLLHSPMPPITKTQQKEIQNLLKTLKR